jgi:hypothetical protein
MGCGISAAVNGLDWYLGSLDQDSLKEAELKSLTGYRKTEPCDVQPAGKAVIIEIRPPERTKSFDLQLNDGIISSRTDLPDGQHQQQNYSKFIVNILYRHSIRNCLSLSGQKLDVSEVFHLNLAPHNCSATSGVTS